MGSGGKTAVWEDLTTPTPQITAAGLFFAALALRLISIGVLPVTDEAITVAMVKRFGTGELLIAIPMVQPHFPLYYVFLDVWGFVAPIEWARSVSFVAGAGVPAVAYYWFRSLVSELRATRAAVLLVLAPPLVVQSRWLRMYSLLALAVLLSWWAAWRWLHDDGSIATYGVLSVVVVGLHPFGVAVIVSQVAWLAIEQYHSKWRPWFRPTVACIGGIGALGVVALLARVAGLMGPTSISAGDMHMQYAAVPVERAIVLPLTALTGSVISAGVLVVVIAATCVLGWWMIRERPWETRHGRLWLCWIGVALAVLFAGHAIRPIILLKYVTWLAPGVALAVVTVTPDDWRGDDVFYILVALMSINLLLAALYKLNVGMVAIRNSGVVESGAL